MSFLASVGVTNVDLMYVGMPRVPQEGEEIFSQDFRVLLGGGAPGTAVTPPAGHSDPSGDLSRQRSVFRLCPRAV